MLEWDPSPGAAWYLVDYARADEAYGTFDPWAPYGSPPAQVAVA